MKLSVYNTINRGQSSFLVVFWMTNCTRLESLGSGCNTRRSQDIVKNNICPLPLKIWPYCGVLVSVQLTGSKWYYTVIMSAFPELGSLINASLCTWIYFAVLWGADGLHESKHDTTIVSEHWTSVVFSVTARTEHAVRVDFCVLFSINWWIEISYEWKTHLLLLLLFFLFWAVSFRGRLRESLASI